MIHREAAVTIAAVICTKDRPDSLRAAINSLTRQSRRPDELLLIDDGALAAAERHALAETCAAAGIPWTYARVSGAGLTAARNLGARLAQSDLLLYVDDDVTCDENCVEAIARVPFDRTATREAPGDAPFAAAALAVEEPAWSSPVARLFQAVYRAAGWWAVRPRGGGRRIFLSGAAMALSRRVVLDNPFDERLRGYALGEDREISLRLARNEYRIARAPAARVVHHRATSGRAEAFQFGRMAVDNYLHILRQNDCLRTRDWPGIVGTFCLLIMAHVVFAAAGRRWHHMRQASGMCAALGEVVWRKMAAIIRGQAPPRLADSGRRISVSAPPRIALVTNRLEHGGAEWMLLTLARQLTFFGVTPEVVCLKDAGPLAAECQRAGISVASGLLRHKFDATVVFRLARLIRKRRIRALIAAGSGGDRMFWSTLAAALTGRRMIVWSHWHPTQAEQRFEPANRLLYPLVDSFVALGSAHAEALAHWERVPAERIRVIANGLDPARVADPATRSAARAALGLKEDECAIALIGNLRPEKRHDVFIEAASGVAQARPETVFFIIGDGPDSVRVRAHIQSSGLSPDRLRWLGARDDVPFLLPALDIVCLCSSVECFSVTMLEAMAAGCAFVGPAVGSLGDVLRDGNTGLVVPPADAAALAAALTRLAGDASLREALGRGGRSLVLARYTAARMTAAFRDLLLETLRADRARRRQY